MVDLGEFLIRIASTIASRAARLTHRKSLFSQVCVPNVNIVESTGVIDTPLVMSITSVGECVVIFLYKVTTLGRTTIYIFVNFLLLAPPFLISTYPSASDSVSLHATWFFANSWRFSTI